MHVFFTFLTVNTLAFVVRVVEAQRSATLTSGTFTSPPPNVTSTTPVDHDLEGPASEASVAFRVTLIVIGGLTLALLTGVLVLLILRHRAQQRQNGMNNKYSLVPTSDVENSAAGPLETITNVNAVQ